MNSSNIIGRWATLLLAEVLNLSASVAEKILLGQPRWLAQLRLMEADLREVGQKPISVFQDDAIGDGQDLAATSTRKMLESYAILSRTLKDIEARGLALDEALIERMNSEWSPKSIVGYLLTCDTQLKNEVGKALNAAAGVVGTASLPVAGHDKNEQRGRAATKKTQRKSAAASKRKPGPAQRKDLVS